MQKYTNLVNPSVAILVGRKPRVINFRGHVRDLGTPVKIQEVSRSRSSRSRKYMNLDRPVDPDGSAFCTNIAQGPEISLIVHK